MPLEILLGDTSLIRKITAFTENAASSQNQVKHWSLLLMLLLLLLLLSGSQCIALAGLVLTL